MDPQSQAIFFIMLMSPCLGTGHPCACSKNAKDCANINQTPVDFQTARGHCEEQGGRLMSIRSNESNEVLGYLLENKIGNFWIGLYLPEGECSNNASVLRGYSWIDGERSAGFGSWAAEGAACSPRCVSVSSDRRWVERPCDEKLDGFLCESADRNLCGGSVASGVLIVDRAQCFFAPCEHKCAPVDAAGYKCSCLNRFVPSDEDPRRCEMRCASAVCDAICLRDGHTCWCPAGFVKSGDRCEDIDECESNHGCAHMCINTIGSYECACHHPFTLVRGSECTLTPGAFEEGGATSTHPVGPPTTASSNYLAKGSLSSPGEYAGIALFLLLAGLALFVVVRYLRARKHSAQECAPPDCEFLESGSKGTI